jgi:hypothetical protein
MSSSKYLSYISAYMGGGKGIYNCGDGLMIPISLSNNYKRIMDILKKTKIDLI